MPTFKYDGVEIPFEPGESIIKAAYRQGIEIPHYCWHPGLTAPANCRMCLVEIMPKPGTRPVSLDILKWDAAKHEYLPQQKPKLQPACQMPAAEGMDVRGDTSDEVKHARKGVQEFLLLNHPVDCPICDQSGECKLQDYWLEHGQYQKRMRDEPVHKPKAVPFGDTIVYDGERCVMCTRCIRFMAEVAKDPVLTMRERGNLNEIAVADGRKLEGKYTFMNDHVCPVGALTTKDFRFKARVWFLKSAKSVCQGCATGCNAHLDYDPRNNKAYRYRPRDNEAVNKYWMCDDGMVSYKEAHEGRILDPVVKSAGKDPFSIAASSPGAALAEAAKLLKATDHSKIAIVLSAEHSMEDNWALSELARLLGATRVYATGKASGYADDILISADKNANTRGVKEIEAGARSFEDLVADASSGTVTTVLALGSAAPSDASGLGSAKVIAIASHDGPITRAAAVVLPATTWAESTGTYVNNQGMHQVSDKALEPLGAAKAGWAILADLADLLGLKPTWSKLKHVRDKLQGVQRRTVSEVPTP